MMWEAIRLLCAVKHRGLDLHSLTVFALLPFCLSVPVAVNFWKSTCSSVDSLVVEHLFSCSQLIWGFWFALVSSHAETSFSQDYKKLQNLGDCITMLLGHKHSGFEEVCSRLFHGTLIWLIHDKAGDFQYERLTNWLIRF